ncbi:MAG: hypothetical protein LBC17_02155 [Lactobacillaceae bacterium]|nr:hypothetical protein [Lactobacillaceae bacterium]
MAKLFLYSNISKSIITSEIKTQFPLFNNFIGLGIILSVFALLSTGIMIFIYRNLLHFFFDSDSWLIIISMLMASFSSILLLMFDKDIDLIKIGMSNATSLLMINILFSRSNKSISEKLMIFFISLLNSGSILFFII